MANLTTVFQESSEPVRAGVKAIPCLEKIGFETFFQTICKILTSAEVWLWRLCNHWIKKFGIWDFFFFFFSDCIMTTIARSIVGYIRRCSSTPLFSLSLSLSAACLLYCRLRNIASRAWTHSHCLQVSIFIW